MSLPSVRQLEPFIVDTFNLSELEDLCLQLDVRYEDLRGDTLSGKSLELVKYMDRRGRLADLVSELARERPEKFAETFGQPKDSALFTLATADANGIHDGRVGRINKRWLLFVILALVALAVQVWLSFGGGGELTGPTATTGAVVSTVTIARPADVSFITITEPTDGSEVKRVITIRGELSGEVCEGCRLYVFVHPLHSQPHYYYPQIDVQVDLNESSFTVANVYVGGETTADNGKQYELWIVISSENILESHMTPEDWTAFRKEEAEYITVIRAEL